jgi:hypothetical protein
MDRKSFLFPPDADDVNGFLAFVQKAKKDLEKGARELVGFRNEAKQSPEVGGGKEKLLRDLADFQESMVAVHDALDGMLEQQERLRADVMMAFHDPQSQRTASYSYDRRK